MDSLILKKRRVPLAAWDEEDDCYRIPNGPSFKANLFHEAPDLISCASVYALGEQWDLPVQVIQAIFEKLPANEMN